MPPAFNARKCTPNAGRGSRLPASGRSDIRYDNGSRRISWRFASERCIGGQTAFPSTFACPAIAGMRAVPLNSTVGGTAAMTVVDCSRGSRIDAYAENRYLGVVQAVALACDCASAGLPGTGWSGGVGFCCAHAATVRNKAASRGRCGRFIIVGPGVLNKFVEFRCNPSEEG